ncbi:hypothetical protein EMGBS6_16240 [Opitutia bacterium]|nr:hypothetical protein EMGBS6_16240 [Opitutae bacterium]
MLSGRWPQTTELPAKTSFAFVTQLSIGLAKATDVNRLRGQPFAAAYLAVWMNIMTPLP